jgi:hypothetical protein
MTKVTLTELGDDYIKDCARIFIKDPVIAKAILKELIY